MSFLPRWLVLCCFSAFALVGCHRPPTQEEISARAAEPLAEQMASKKAGAEQATAELSEADKDLLDQTNTALDEIIIPRVDFRDVTLRQAVFMIQNRAIEIARELPDRVRTLPAFYIKYEFAPQYLRVNENPVVQPLEPSESHVITMNLSNLPLREALQYCASLFNFEMKVQPGVVLFEPIN